MPIATKYVLSAVGQNGTKPLATSRPEGRVAEASSEFELGQGVDAIPVDDAWSGTDACHVAYPVCVGCHDRILPGRAPFDKGLRSVSLSQDESCDMSSI